MVRRREFTPGQILSENQLAKLLHVGRTPVREAVLRLRYEGLFEMLPKRGILVRSLDSRDIAELYEVRSRLETLAVARAAAGGVPKSGVERLQQLIEAQTEAARAEEISPDRLRAIDREFHSEIWLHADNRRLRSMLLSLLDAAELDPLWDQIMVVLAQRQDAHSEHQEILDAIVARDPARAEEAMRKHNRSYQQSLVDRMMSDGFAPRPA